MREGRSSGGRPVPDAPRLVTSPITRREPGVQTLGGERPQQSYPGGPSTATDAPWPASRPDGPRRPGGVRGLRCGRSRGVRADDGTLGGPAEPDHDTFVQTVAVTLLRTLTGLVGLIFLPVVVFLSKIHRAADAGQGLQSLLTIHGDRRGDDSLRRLSTHPPIEKRVDRLVEQSGRSVRRHHLGRLRP